MEAGAAADKETPCAADQMLEAMHKAAQNCTLDTLGWAAQHGPGEEQRSFAIFSHAGLTRQHIRLSETPRLAKALHEEGSGSLQECLAKKLPSAILQALSDRTPSEPLLPIAGKPQTNLISRIEKLIVEESGREATLHPTCVADESLDEETVAKEEAPLKRGELVERGLAQRGELTDRELVEFEAQEAAREQFNARLNKWGLTKRETEIATLKWLEGMENSEIAAELAIAESTVRVHVKNIEQKGRHAEAS